MEPRELKRLDRELTAYTDSLIAGMGRPERRQAMADYVTGLLLDGDRKRIEPMAGRLVDDVAEIQAMRQRLQQCVTVSPWRDDEMWQRLAIKGDAELPDLEAWVVDDTGFPKKGIHSVGVQRQFSGTLGRRDNCQVAVSLHLAGVRGSACIGMQLYLPESWTSDRERCRAVGVPGDISFQKEVGGLPVANRLGNAVGHRPTSGPRRRGVRRRYGISRRARRERSRLRRRDPGDAFPLAPWRRSDSTAIGSSRRARRQGAVPVEDWRAEANARLGTRGIAWSERLPHRALA